LRCPIESDWHVAAPELRLNPAVIRQQMGHSSEKMTAHYTGQIPLEEVKAAFSKAKFSSKSGNKIVVLENMENEPAA
jgi:hypothetical protein